MRITDEYMNNIGDWVKWRLRTKMADPKLLGKKARKITFSINPW